MGGINLRRRIQASIGFGGAGGCSVACSLASLLSPPSTHCVVVVVVLELSVFSTILFAAGLMEATSIDRMAKREITVRPGKSIVYLFAANCCKCTEFWNVI